MQCIKRASGPDSLCPQSWKCTTAPLPLDCPDLIATSLLVLLNAHPSAITTYVTAGSMPISGGHRMWSR